MAADDAAPPPEPTEADLPEMEVELVDDEAEIVELSPDDHARLWLAARSERIRVDIEAAAMLTGALGFPPPPSKGDPLIFTPFDAGEADEDVAAMLRGSLAVVLGDIKRQIEAGTTLEDAR